MINIYRYEYMCICKIYACSYYKITTYQLEIGGTGNSRSCSSIDIDLAITHDQKILIRTLEASYEVKKHQCSKKSQVALKRTKK